jgi:hypothetical protein
LISKRFFKHTFYAEKVDTFTYLLHTDIIHPEKLHDWFVKFCPGVAVNPAGRLHRVSRGWKVRCNEAFSSLGECFIGEFAGNLICVPMYYLLSIVIYHSCPERLFLFLLDLQLQAII